MQTTVNLQKCPVCKVDSSVRPVGEGKLKHLNNDRGLALFVVLAMLVVLMTITGASSMFTSMPARRTANTRNGTVALHIADAGINHAVRELSNADGTNGMSTIYVASSGTQIVSNNSFNGGTYAVTL